MENKIKEILWKYSDESYDGDINQTAYIYSDDFTRMANELVKLFNLHCVTVLLPSDKVIEDWYTKDFDSLTVRFWEEAPYCTHGDRVEEIKDAVHYFITGNERSNNQ